MHVLRSGVEARVWACGCGGCARGCARVGLHRPKGTIAAPNAPVCLSRACGCVFRACAVSFPWVRPVRPHVRPLLRGGRGRHARAVRGRYISSTKVKALPESLGQCKLLEFLCVPRPLPPLLRVALPRRALGPSRAALDAAAAALPVVGRGRAPRTHGWRARPTGARSGVGRSRPARPHGWRAGTRATPSSRRCRRRPTGRASRHCECRRRRAHAAAPMRRRGGGRVVSARTRRARLGTCVRA
jgi:hypothetical protein